jgi:hypothetical protein
MPDGRAVLNAIMDQEIATAEHIEAVTARLEGSTLKRLRLLARRVYALRQADKVGRRDARLLFVRGFVALLLAEYAHDIPKLKAMTDEHLETQFEAVKNLKVRLSTLPAIRGEDLKARKATRLAETGNTIDLAAKLKGPGPGRLPDLKNLGKKTPDQLVATLERFGLEPDVKAFEKRANRVYRDRLEAVIEEKGAPDKHTWAAIDADLERATVQTLRVQTKQAIHEYRKRRLLGVAKYFVWIAVNSGKESCPSCDNRHGQRNTMPAWEILGMPGSSILVCRSECRCSLQPDFVSDEGDEE